MAPVRSGFSHGEQSSSEQDSVSKVSECRVSLCSFVPAFQPDVGLCHDDFEFMGGTELVVTRNSRATAAESFGG